VVHRGGDEMVRTALYQAAHVLMHHGRWSGLRGWAMRIAKRSGAKLAKVALGRWHRVSLDNQGASPRPVGVRSNDKKNRFTSAYLAVSKCPDGYEG
jgi:hypothetical protein